MSIVTGKYESKPQPDPNIKPVEAIQLTADNIEQVAEWCSGFVKTVRTIDEDEKAVELAIFQGPRVASRPETAYLGDWVAKNEDGFFVFLNEFFTRVYQLSAEVDPNMLALKEIGESVLQHHAVREVVWNAIWRSKKVFDSASSDQRKEASLVVVAQMAINDIEKIFKVED